MRAKLSTSTRWVASLLVVFAGAIALAVDSDGANAASHVRTCQEDHLSIAVQSAGAGLGHFAYRIVLTNIGPGACELSGYLRATLVGGPSSAPTLAAKETKRGYLGGLRSESERLPVVVLRAPRGRASALVEGTDVPDGDATTCANYTTLNIARIKGWAYAFPIRFTGCSRPQIHPLVAGSTGSQL